MKKFAALLWCFVITCFCCLSATAQQKAITRIAGVKEEGSDMLFTLTSSKPFIYGNNRYTLYIGNKDFARSEQSKKNGKGVIIFYIPSSEFKMLKEGAGMYLSYGSADPEDEDMEALAKNSRRCWALGAFSKSLLKK
jgi:hypothetical protein